MFLSPCQKVYQKGEVFQHLLSIPGELRKRQNSDNVQYMDIKRIRFLNINLILKEKYQGKKNKLANDLGIKDSYISRYFTNKPSYKRGISDGMARKIEEVSGMAHGWMDTPHESLWESVLNVKQQEGDKLATTPRETLVRLMTMADVVISEYALANNIKFTDEQIYEILFKVIDFAGTEQFSDDFVKQYTLELAKKASSVK